MKKKYALVTGASSGIGYQYARVLAQRGYNLIIVSNENAITEKADILRCVYPNLDIVPKQYDLARQDAAAELYAWCKEHQFQVEVLVNNAGVFHDCDFLDDTEAFNQLILNLHVITPSLLVYHFGQDMVVRKRGYILNMSSVSSDFGTQRLSTYASTKGYLRLFSRSLHIELKAKGVYVTCVRPGAVATSLYNLDDKGMQLGLRLGVITTPGKIAQKGINALFRGKCMIAPGIFTKILELVPHIPVCVLLLLRKWRWL